MSIYLLNQTIIKIEFSPFFLSSLGRLAQCSLDVSLWLTHKSPASAQVHAITVFNELHFNRYHFYQWYTPTALMKDAISN